MVDVPKIANAGRSIRHVFIRDLVMACSIGIHQHEKDDEQRVRINLDLAVDEGGQEINDNINNVICYEELAKGVEEILDRASLSNTWSKRWPKISPPCASPMCVSVRHWSG